MKKYNKWGLIFVLPYSLSYMIFTAFPLIKSLHKSFYENYFSGIKEIGPTFVGLDNYIKLLATPELITYFENTMIMWIAGFIPQIIISLLLASWFSDIRLNLKGSRLFKTVIYFPNLIMSASFASLFFSFFADYGPVNDFLIRIGFISQPFQFFSSIAATRSLIVFMNCIMWFGNTTLLLLAGMLGIDRQLVEAAEVDGATSIQVFFKITLPILKPILLYVVITSLIGGLQMFDVPQILTNATGNPLRSSMTLLMYLNKYMYSKNYGMAGALSILMFIVTAMMSLSVFSASNRK